MDAYDAFHEIVKQTAHRLRGVFFGHIHQNMEIVQDGVLYSGVPSSWYQFHTYPGQEETVIDHDSDMGFNVVTITPDQTLIQQPAREDGTRNCPGPAQRTRRAT